jgi:hypothetical protein
MTITINGFTHTWPDDVDMVVLSPSGVGYSFLSDIGGGNSINGVTYTISDAAPAAFTTGFNASGTYRPTDFLSDAYGAIPFPVQYPAPAAGATFSSVFGGLNANGQWRLYVIDDFFIDAGTISGGWSINFAVPVPGCTFATACNYNPLAGVDDGSCDYSCYGCTYSAAINYSPVAYIDDGSCQFQLVQAITDGCIDPTACNYCSVCTVDDGSCDYSCLGCIYPAAVNYNPTAQKDDGSCIYGGCTDVEAFNFNPLAQQDDGSCIYDNQCAADVNQDGVVGVADIIGIMTYFGNTCN